MDIQFIQSETYWPIQTELVIDVQMSAKSLKYRIYKENK